jgi:hypothetical protein
MTARTKLLTLKITPPERQTLRNEAARRGVTQADLVRQALSAAGVPLWGAAVQR